MTESDLIAALEDAGVHVVFLPYPKPGSYWHAHQLIVIDARLSSRWQRCTLAHEAVHAWYGHEGPCAPETEAWVDERAAGLLVTEQAYARAEWLHGPDVHAIADELDVTPWVIEAFQRTLRRVA
ncbi:ImmA/IrrE family metallo-endopeptidase [Flaviflexus equikiangi]|uniref:ImmA/IrrE family metallo-endopeptidase n=1 Tax=Flaviflexus equikiangi TaxID=2758573 RepID=A0ABS2TCL4_9ACTO|nr:ImmA/IrrE family metallo-endopeptidase [Flaviflexus equikiangi]MBM9432376.1 ImmA/IrrE family metallo-endopeptidase [Flaviflexus equikiangi]